MRYLDRWEPDENRELFPELGGGATFPKPDVVANLDTDRLSALADGSQDFVIASHIIEHLADPLGQLHEIHRVLRPGGAALLLLPDRRRTFDLHREPTPLKHLITEHAAGTTSVSDEHIEEFMRSTNLRERWEALSIRDRIERHRKRSIHVHCWTQEEFVSVLDHTIIGMNMTWELLDASFVDDAPGSIEFGFVLRRATVTTTRAAAAQRLRIAVASLAERARANEGLRARLGRLEIDASEAEARTAASDAELGAILQSRSWRMTSALRRARQHLGEARRRFY